MFYKYYYSILFYCCSFHLLFPSYCNCTYYHCNCADLLIIKCLICYLHLPCRLQINHCFFIFSHLHRIASCPSQSVSVSKRRLGCWRVYSIPTLSAFMIPGRDLAKERSALFWSPSSWHLERLKRKCEMLMFKQMNLKKIVSNVKQIFSIWMLGEHATKKNVEFNGTNGAKQVWPHFPALSCEPRRCRAQSQ